MEFIELGSARENDVIVAASGLVVTIRSVDDWGLECTSGAGDATDKIESFRWGGFVSPTDQVLLLYRPPEQP
jgi:hypothetical protein